MVGVVSAAVAVEGELADIGGEGRVGELRRVFDAVDEAGFGESVVAAVEPDVETIGLAGIVALGNGDAHGLDGAVELGVVAENLAALLQHPRRLSFVELAAALDALVKDGEEAGDVLGVDKALREFQEPFAGLGIDVYIGDEVFVDFAGAQVFDRGIDLVDFGLVLAFLFAGELRGRRRGAPSAPPGSGGGRQRLRLLDLGKG